jgi:hypothetical protein
LPTLRCRAELSLERKPGPGLARPR